ncbi:hypothetical protein B0J12DRAFT_395703 [Macrophomina phaseolina]|uniref:Uncharacterized protein n=1 Tax=Macrophomina phaseolina TaxID=35725 RepID=A0ABQ8FSC5_9PEZI|nr:hypothetical protein B0J12DRAFT_395703 [Macrophomina phaseolina]
MQLSYILLITATFTSTGYAKQWHFCTCRMGRGKIASSTITDKACKRLVGWGIAGSFWNSNRNYEGYSGDWCTADTGERRSINGPNFHGYCRDAGATDSCCVLTDSTNTFVTDSSDGC